MKFQIDSEQFEKILRYIRSGIQSNATLECGGDRIGNKGYFVQPTVFSNVQVEYAYEIILALSLKINQQLKKFYFHFVIG